MVKTIGKSRGNFILPNFRNPLRFLFILLVTLLEHSASSRVDAQPRRGLTESSSSTSSDGDPYGSCYELLDGNGVEEQCGRQIEPSGVAYLPSHGRLVVVGKNHILHFSEKDEAGGDRTLSPEGCYSGDDLSLGRGDLESAASLDVLVSSHSPLPGAPLNAHENWRRLKSMDRFVLVFEEDYAFRGAYLVDTNKLGHGKTRHTEATIHKFPFPIYLNNLEASAFVPDLSDDDYLGMVVLGSQRGEIVTCRVPLANLDLYVTCNKLIRYPGSIDSMEFDPTFEVQPGVFGALVIGTDPQNEAFYVDPWELAINNKVVLLSEKFPMASGKAGDVEIKGREGHAIYGNRAFYAIDENRGDHWGVVVCNLANKPTSFSNPRLPPPPQQDSEARIAPPPPLPLQQDHDFILMKKKPPPAETGQPAPPSPPAPVFGDVSVMTESSSKDISQSREMQLIGQMDRKQAVERWMMHAKGQDDRCGASCRREKNIISMLYPELAIVLRCYDIKAGLDSPASLSLDSTCDTPGIAAPATVIAVGFSNAQVLIAWHNAAIATEDPDCAGDVCQALRATICTGRQDLCREIKCVRSYTIEGNDKFKMPNVTRALPQADDDECADVAAPQIREDVAPMSLTAVQARKRWNAHHTAKGSCGSKCRHDKRLICLAIPHICWELRCLDIADGTSPTVIHCRTKPPRYLPDTLLNPEAFHLAVHDGYCTYDACPQSAGLPKNDAPAALSLWCHASSGNCAVGCLGTWCFSNTSLPAINAISPPEIGNGASYESSSSSSSSIDGRLDSKPDLANSSSELAELQKTSIDNDDGTLARNLDSKITSSPDDNALGSSKGTWRGMKSGSNFMAVAGSIEQDGEQESLRAQLGINGTGITESVSNATESDQKESLYTQSP